MKPMTTRLQEARAVPRLVEEQKEATVKFAKALVQLPGGSSFGSALLEATEPAMPVYKKTKYGTASILAPLAYQQPLLPFGFATLTSNIASASATVEVIPQEFKFFEGCDAWVLPPHLKGNHILEVSPIPCR